MICSLVKVSFLTSAMLLTPLTSYGDEQACYQEVTEEDYEVSGWAIAGAAVAGAASAAAIALTAGLATPAVIATTGGLMVGAGVGQLADISIQTIEEKQRITDCLNQKHKKDLKVDQTVERYKELLREADQYKNYKKFRYNVDADEYKQLEGSIGYKFIGLDVKYERQSNNKYTMEIEYK